MLRTLFHTLRINYTCNLWVNWPAVRILLLQHVNLCCRHGADLLWIFPINTNGIVNLSNKSKVVADFSCVHVADSQRNPPLQNQHWQFCNLSTPTFAQLDMDSPLHIYLRGKLQKDCPLGVRSSRAAPAFSHRCGRLLGRRSVRVGASCLRPFTWPFPSAGPL